MQSSTPDGQSSRPNYSVHALKPLTKILSFGPLGRKPAKASRRGPCRAWSTDTKYRRHGLIATKMADLQSPKPFRAAVMAVFSAQPPTSTQLFADIEDF